MIDGVAARMDASPPAPRNLREADLASAERVFRVAFGTFLGLPDPASFGGDADHVATRWRADPSLTLCVERGDQVVASNFVTLWGSAGFFGPLTVRPDLWNQGIAQQLMEPTVALLDRHRVRWGGLFTFADSPKHIGLYRKFGFVPQQLTGLFSRPVAGARVRGWSRMSEAGDRDALLAACAEITEAILEGLDMRREILAVLAQGLGEVVLLEAGDRLGAFAVCHIGRGSEAGSGTCYVKAAAVRPGPGAGELFDRLLDACDDLASRSGASLLLAGVNEARQEAHARIQRRGFSPGMRGVIMTRPDSPGYNRPGVYLVDDWR
jgi:GNAT superfamily N-acetyltransferase